MKYFLQQQESLILLHFVSLIIIATIRIFFKQWKKSIESIRFFLLSYLKKKINQTYWWHFDDISAIHYPGCLTCHHRVDRISYWLKRNYGKWNAYLYSKCKKTEATSFSSFWYYTLIILAEVLNLCIFSKLLFDLINKMIYTSINSDVRR